jgi:hypothetical protein
MQEGGDWLAASPPLAWSSGLSRHRPSLFFQLAPLTLEGAVHELELVALMPP